MVSTRRAGREQVVDAQQCRRADARPIVPGGRPTGFLGSGEIQCQTLEKSASGRAECGLRSAGDRFPARSMPKIEDSCPFVTGRRCCERAGALVIAAPPACDAVLRVPRDDEQTHPWKPAYFQAPHDNTATAPSTRAACSACGCLGGGEWYPACVEQAGTSRGVRGVRAPRAHSGTGIPEPGDMVEGPSASLH
jgi:hypothetical protein